MKKLCSLMLLLAVGGCLEGDGVTAPVEGTVPFFGASQFARALPRPQTWVDGEKFNGVVTPATFDPASGNFDELYTCGGPGMFAEGVPLISESKPGDQDYNGGRWHLNVLKAGKVCNGAAVGVGDLVLGDFAPMEVYFECPLLPIRGRNG